MGRSTLPAADRAAPSGPGPGQAHVVEIFSSIQGEGIYVGKRHIFVRLFACNLRCLYCDTPDSLTGQPPAKLEQTAGQGDFATCDNPLSAQAVEECIARLARTPHDAVSLTGGERLLQAGFLLHLLPRIHSLGLRTYLETNGTLPGKLAEVAHLVDTVAMDIKLPKTLTDGRDWLPVHEEFLRAACATEVFCKLVLTPGTDVADVRRAAMMVARVSAEVPFIIQPVTPFGDVAQAPSQSEILEAFEAASSYVNDVRVIPQTHKMVHLR